MHPPPRFIRPTTDEESGCHLQHLICTCAAIEVGGGSLDHDDHEDFPLKRKDPNLRRTQPNSP